MSLYIVGTGRSGTKSVAEALGGEHEPCDDVICAAAAHYTAGRWPPQKVAYLLDTVCELPEVSAHYRYAEIVEVLAAADPDARFLWVRRDLEATVASMVRKRWYLPSDDFLWPVQTAAWVTEGGARLRLDTNHSGLRANPVMLGGDYRWWHGLSQADRCRWWCGFVESRLSGVLPQLGCPFAVVGLEDLDGESLREIAGWAGLAVRPGRMPWLNKGGA